VSGESGGSGAGHGGPRRGYSWEPFRPGHDVSTKHGAYSVELVEADVARLLTDLQREGAPWLNVVDGPELQAWLRAEAALRRVHDWLDVHGWLDEKGKPRPATELWSRLDRAAARARAALGFNPTSRAALGRDTATARALSAQADEELRRAGAETAAGRRLRGLPSGDDDGPGDAA
jgi:hypothetical protein